MAGLPPKPGDVLPPRPTSTRERTSPRAASMRERPMSRDRGRDSRDRGRDGDKDRDRDPDRGKDSERDRDRDRDRDRERDREREREWERDRERDDRRRDPRRFPSPRRDSWKPLGRGDDRFQNQFFRGLRDRDDRDGRWFRGGRDRGIADTYRPDMRPLDPMTRRRSPVSRHRSPRSPSGTRSPPPSRRHHGSESNPGSRSLSPRGNHFSRRSPRRPASPQRSRNASPERRSPRPNRSRSPRHFKQQEAPTLKQNEVKAGPSPNPPTESLVVNAKNSPINNKNVAPTLHEKPPIQPSPVKLATHPLPLGPRRPRTPTGPRSRTPIYHRIQDRIAETITNHQEINKGKGKDVPRADGPDHNQQRERSQSPPKEPKEPRKPAWQSSRSPSISLSHSHSPSHHHPHSRHDTPLENMAQHLKKDLLATDKSGSSRKMSINIDDLIIIPPVPPRESKTSEQDAELKRIKEQRTKLDSEHASVTRSVRRAQHELDLALLELKSTEERRKAAERVHERTVKGFLPPIT